MYNNTAGLTHAFFDALLAPPIDLIAQFIKSISFYDNYLSEDFSTMSRINIQMTEEDLHLFIFMKYAWSLFFVLLVFLGSSFLLYYCFYFFFVPFNRIKRLGSIGYLNHEEGNQSKKEVANLIRRRRKLGDELPPVYPNGWFRLLDSLQLRTGEVKEVIAFGEHFAVFRSQSGKVSVLDAYCPHMGGNLAVGGRVKENCLECPFHGWKFDGDGICVDIPYSDKVPNFAKTKSWTCNEVNGAIYVWYHCDGESPQWEIPEVESISNGEYRYLGRVEHHVNTHIQDLPENGSDQAHLSHLHVPFFPAGSDLSRQFTSWLNICDHIFKAESLGSSKEEPHVSSFNLIHYLEVFKRWKLLKFDFKVYQIGPGMVHLHFTSWFWKGIFVQALTPHEQLHQVMTHNLYANWTVPLWLGKIFLYIEAVQVDRDVMIWNNKTFKPRPKLVKEDKLISQYRRWFSQFYTKNSPKLQMKGEDDLQWAQGHRQLVGRIKLTLDRSKQPFGFGGRLKVQPVGEDPRAGDVPGSKKRIRKHYTTSIHEVCPKETIPYIDVSQRLSITQIKNIDPITEENILPPKGDYEHILVLIAPIDSSPEAPISVITSKKTVAIWQTTNSFTVLYYDSINALNSTNNL